jgi:hypothetical protein
MPVSKAIHRFSKALEVKPANDDYEKIETTRWGNRRHLSDPRG